MHLAGPNQTVREVDGKPVSDSALGPAGNMDHGYIFSSSKRWRECFADAYANKFDPASNIRDMEREGIDVSVLFPTMGLYIMWRDDIDPELSAAICRAYNTWLADYCDHDRKRLYGVMLFPLQDPARAVEELNMRGKSWAWWASSGVRTNCAAGPSQARIIIRFTMSARS